MNMNMDMMKNDQIADRTDNRGCPKSWRGRLALTGYGLAGLMVLGAFFGGAQGALASAQQKSAQVATSTSSQTQAVSDYQTLARQAAKEYGINPDTFVRQIQQESQFNPEAVSPAGALGIAQFMPFTAAGMEVNANDPTSALRGAAKLMHLLSEQFNGDYAKALAAYNAGPDAVGVAVYKGGKDWLSFLPTETQNYVSIIQGQ